MSIAVKELFKQYGEQKAVNQISFDIGKTGVVGFLGPNGAGKTTTMKILAGCLQKDGGDAFVCGINVSENPQATKKKIGYLPEGNPLYTDMYVWEYLGFIASVHGIRDAKEKIRSVAALTGLMPEKRKKISQLSRGYKQRVGLAAALIHEPEVLILDEPTSGLDPNQVIEIRDVIKSQGQHKTVLFSSHILQEVEAVCDRVIIINKGRLVADDSLHHLRQGSNSNIVKINFKEKLEAGTLEKLPAAAGVSNTDPFNWQITTTDPELLRKQIFELSLREQLNIISLQSEQQSLEEVFRELTTGVTVSG